MYAFFSHTLVFSDDVLDDMHEMDFYDSSKVRARLDQFAAIHDGIISFD